MRIRNTAEFYVQGGPVLNSVSDPDYLPNLDKKGFPGIYRRTKSC